MTSINTIIISLFSHLNFNYVIIISSKIYDINYLGYCYECLSSKTHHAHQHHYHHSNTTSFIVPVISPLCSRTIL